VVIKDILWLRPLTPISGVTGRHDKLQNPILGVAKIDIPFGLFIDYHGHLISVDILVTSVMFLVISVSGSNNMNLLWTGD
jgi:hypothetical protein